MEMNDMKRKNPKLLSTIISAFLLVGILVAAPFALPQSQSTSSPQASPRTFTTPQEAAAVLIKAASDYDVSALLQIFGADGEDIISTADPVADKNRATQFAALAQTKHSIKTYKSNKAILVIGDDDWPFPVPLVKKAGKWSFDSKAGRNEILYRRIGANELNVIQICRGYVEAQVEYASAPHEGSTTPQYAQKIISSPGKQDGLYWENADGTPGGPISEKVAKAIQEGYSVDKRSAYHGYYFKILKGQGPAAPLGRLDYVIQGAMIGGFALIAAPAEYGVTGVKTFIVSNDGVVYQKDLGPDTLNVAKQIELFNPDKTWQPTFDGWPETQGQNETASAQ
jgi:Protein of unknown function (DUF2950)